MTESIYNKNNPFMATLSVRRRENAEESIKETVHLEIDLGDSNLVYKAGDSLGVFPQNSEHAVSALLNAYHFNGDEKVTLPKTTEPVSLKYALTKEFSIGPISKKFAQVICENLSDESEKTKLTEFLNNPNAEEQKAWIENRHLIDLAEEYPSVRISAQELINNLRKLTPRLYSISSSPDFVGNNKVHLTVAVVRYTTNGRKRDGVCSTFLGEYAPLNQAVLPVFVSNSHFGPPQNQLAPMIMVGPGTGIAPFRAFIQERAAKKAPGKNWLFFGDQHAKTDFLYKKEWEEALASGLLYRLDLAWSRDQEYKIYVQDKIRNAGEKIWNWINNDGAYFFVCGDAKRMAKDVETALIDVFQQHGHLSEAEALEKIKALKKDNRYLRDVY